MNAALGNAVRYMFRLFQKTSNRFEHDALLKEMTVKAAALQKYGYEIGFAFVPRMPDSPHLYFCNSRYKTEQYACGYDYSSRGAAMRKALSEIVERFLWHDDAEYWKNGSIHGSHASLGSPSIDPCAVAGFSIEQLKRVRGAVPLTAATQFLWSPCLSLADGSSVFVPTQLISGRYARGSEGTEPLLRIPTSNGLACHRSYDEALYRGALELVERDAFMIAFYNKISAPRVDTMSLRNPELAARVRDMERFGFEVHLILLPTDAPTTIIACVLLDKTAVGPALSLGAKAHHDPEEAAGGALIEAHAVWQIAREKGAFKQPLPPEPWDTIARIAYWGKPEHTALFSWFWSGPCVPLPDTGHTARNIRTLARALKEKGVDLYGISLSPPFVRSLGLEAVCVVSPQLQPLSLHSTIRYDGGARLRSIPVAFGYTPASEPPAYPHPFP